MALPADSGGKPSSSPIAGSVFPVQGAEELLSSLAGVLSARVVTTPTGMLEAIHVLTSVEVPPKQTVRNVESALMAHFGMKVDHRKISVATTVEPVRPWKIGGNAGGGEVKTEIELDKRRLYFEDVEVRRSRTKGVTCKVTLRKDGVAYHGEAEGIEHDKAWVELAAHAALVAIMQAEGADAVPLAVYGTKVVEAFDREYVFVGITARVGRDALLLTGSCEVRESAETSSVLAVLDATNRWMAREG